MGKAEPIIMYATGMTGVGKTYRTLQMVKAYHKQHPNRPILFLDTNNEFGKFCKSIYFDIIDYQMAHKEKLKNPKKGRVTKTEDVLRNFKKGIRRIEPFTMQGRQDMSSAQFRMAMILIVKNFFNGLVIFDDVNTYMMNANWTATDVISIFKKYRHPGLDLVFHAQSLEPLVKYHYEATSVIRMQYDTFSLQKIRDRLGEYYQIMRIAQYIVKDQYEDKNNERFCLFVWLRSRKIKGVTKEQFLLGCQTYLIREGKKDEDLDALEKEVAYDNKRHKPNHTDKERAWVLWKEQKLRYIE